MGEDVDDVVFEIERFNMGKVHGDRIKKIEYWDESRKYSKLYWRDAGPNTITPPEMRRDQDMPQPLSTDMIIAMKPFNPKTGKKITAEFVTLTVRHLNNKGHKPVGPNVHFQEDIGIVQNRVLLTFEDEPEFARCYFYTWHAYIWDSSTGADPIRFNMSNLKFQTELSNAPNLREVSKRGITWDESVLIERGRGMEVGLETPLRAIRAATTLSVAMKGVTYDKPRAAMTQQDSDVGDSWARYLATRAARDSSSQPPSRAVADSSSAAAASTRDAVLDGDDDL